MNANLKRGLIAITTLLLLIENTNAWVRSNKDEWFVKKYEPEYLKPGDGVNYPRIGEVVNILYSFIDPETFKEKISSWNKNDPFQLRAGRGLVTVCMDDTVLRMTKGEKIRVKCPHQSAYGYRGREDYGIGSETDLLLEIKLLSIETKKSDL